MNGDVLLATDPIPARQLQVRTYHDRTQAISCGYAIATSTKTRELRCYHTVISQQDSNEGPFALCFARVSTSLVISNTRSVKQALPLGAFWAKQPISHVSTFGPDWGWELVPDSINQSIYI